MASTLACPRPEFAALHSRRRGVRRRARPRGRARTTLPDWVWGVVIGVFVVAVVGGFFLVRTGIGGGGGTCDKPLPPLGNSEISEKAFQEEDAAIGRILVMLASGDVQGAESAFFGPVHNFTHNIDPPLRQKNEKLAKDLCQAVIRLEDSLALRAGAVKIGMDLQNVRNLLRDAAQALGYTRPQ